MNDLISRQAALEAVEKAATKECARWVIKEIPPVDAAPVVRAHWKDAPQGIHDSPHVICSACGGYFWQYFKTFRYCPNCGARIDEWFFKLGICSDD